LPWTWGHLYVKWIVVEHYLYAYFHVLVSSMFASGCKLRACDL
jgi:hypothetical protein